MSTSLVLKSLEVVDPTCSTDRKKIKKGKEVFGLVPKSQKCITKKHHKGGKVETINLLAHKGKISVNEVRKNIKSKEQILKENLMKLELIEKASKVVLDEEILNRIIERGVTKRPVRKIKKQKKGDQKTAFTEEDFKKFEEEYFHA